MPISDARIRRALAAGLENLTRHVENLGKFGLPVVVALNAFANDSAAEQDAVLAHCHDELLVKAHLCRHWSEGAAGAVDLARSVAALADAEAASFRLLYPDTLPLADKLRIIASEIYRADDIALSGAAARQLKTFTEQGFGHLPVCIAKTPYSFTADESVKGATTGFTLPIREVPPVSRRWLRRRACRRPSTPCPACHAYRQRSASGVNEAGAITGLA